jgi:hypothetical protein
MRKIGLGIFISVVLHVGLWFFLGMYVVKAEALRNFILLTISFLIWILSICIYVLMTSGKE